MAKIDPRKKILKLDKETNMQGLRKTMQNLDDAGRNEVLRGLSQNITSGGKDQVIQNVRSIVARAEPEIKDWIVEGVSKTYVNGLNQAIETASTVPKSEGTVLYKWSGGEKGDLESIFQSRFGDETVGQGTYFSLDPESSSMFGDKLNSYIAPKKDLKIYDATGGMKSTSDVTGQLAKNAMYRKMLLAGETDFLAFMKKQGYSGVTFFADDGKHKWVAIDNKKALTTLKPNVPPAKPVTVDQLKTDPIYQEHVKIVNALIGDAYLDFGNAMSGYVKGAERIMNDALKRQIRSNIASGRLEGASIPQIKKTVKTTLQDQGFTVLIDRGGAKWSLANYSEMLARTHIIKANTEGVVNRAGDYGIDIVEVSSNGATDSICSAEEGKIYSVSGKSVNYPPLDGHEPPYHPNCRHTLLLRPELE